MNSAGKISVWGDTNGSWPPDWLIIYDGTFPTNRWVHVVGTNNGSTGKIYLDGQEVVSGTSGTQQSNTGSLFIGNFYNNTYAFNGYIDDVSVFSRALSANEVKALFLGNHKIFFHNFL